MGKTKIEDIIVNMPDNEFDALMEEVRPLRQFSIPVEEYFDGDD